MGPEKEKLERVVAEGDISPASVQPGGYAIHCSTCGILTGYSQIRQESTLCVKCGQENMAILADCHKYRVTELCGGDNCRLCGEIALLTMIIQPEKPQ